MTPRVILPAIILFVFTSFQIAAQVDTDLTTKTKALYSNLKKIESGNTFLFGQEFFNSYRFSSGAAHGDETFSDSKQVTGSHPAVLGSDFHYYLEKNDTERGYHTDAVKWAYQQGYVITFDWHISARGTTSYEYTAANDDLVPNIVNPADASGDRAWLFAELDKVIKIINEDLVVDNDTIPIIFRPWHEMNGGWFWWGSNGATSEEYKSLYKLTVDYMKERTRSVLFCWSPNSPFNDARYPGDAYVDIVGVDAYEVSVNSLRTEVGKVVDFAAAHKKIAVFSETGDRKSKATAGNYWKNVILPGILDDPSGKSKRIAWVLTWINASWSEPYVPHSGSSQSVKQNFIDFRNSPAVLFGDELPTMYEPITDVPVNIEDDISRNRLNAYFKSDSNTVVINLDGFRKPVKVEIVDMTGRVLYSNITREKEIAVRLGSGHGVLILTASDSKKVVKKKILKSPESR